ncbi:MAG TPA: hypothetical protein VHG51_20280 [Longimicrobiaceae bacterium]|nr:hypothetical protein [Longimicrobiaceae bacterium]
MKYFTQNVTVLGTVTEVDVDQAAFTLRCRSGDTFRIHAGVTTWFTVVRNIDGLDRDRVPDPDGHPAAPGPSDQVHKYIRTDELVAVEAVYLEHEGRSRYDARKVTLMHADQGEFLFEETHWWLTQIARFADEWLDDLFKDKRTYEWDDFARLYRTNLNILGEQTSDDTQECATLSRLIYGLSSAYLLTGAERYRLAARAGVKYQRETFRSLSHDGQYAFWMFGKRKRDLGAHLIVASENEDDRGSIPLYEQIYALAGLCQYYRITQDWEVLEDVRRTVKAFQDFYRDTPEEERTSPHIRTYTGTGGYFSHIDYATLRPDVDALGDNKLRKNWNSIGDHIPAYLVNLILALDPLPSGGKDYKAAEELLATCHQILRETSELIVTQFPPREGESSRFVHERFLSELGDDGLWKPDPDWRWQQNRAIVGHDLKIAWNLTRVAHFYRGAAAEARRHGKTAEARGHEEFVDRLMQLATRLGDDMAVYGIDQVRGGCFDAVEREPRGDLPIEFAWSNTKDFWQQEQAILAYLVLHGATDDPRYLGLARDMMAFWNLFFLDHDNRGVYFRVTDTGIPVIQGAYSQKAGHAVAGYHSFELNFLAHVYIRSYLGGRAAESPVAHPDAAPMDENFCLFFRPDPDCGRTTINVLPDFLPPGAVEIVSVKVNGVPRPPLARDNFQIQLDEDELGAQVIVEFCPVRHHLQPGGRR